MEAGAFRLSLSSGKQRPMKENFEPLEIFWDAILSREPDRIRAAFASLDERTRRFTLEHLRRMTTEEGWLPEQRLSAQAALDALA